MIIPRMAIDPKLRAQPLTPTNPPKITIAVIVIILAGFVSLRYNPSSVTDFLILLVATLILILPIVLVVLFFKKYLPMNPE